jgi:hypothetical protein
MVIRRFGVLSVAKIWGALYALIGLIAGAIIALISLAGGFASLAAQENGGGAGAFMGAFFGVGAIIALPIFYGVFGFVGGLIGSALYNWLAGMVGGIEVELQGAPGTGAQANVYS